MAQHKPPAHNAHKVAADEKIRAHPAHKIVAQTRTLQ
jgi:hypothetical protein